jgi:hypothetical protein
MAPTDAPFKLTAADSLSVTIIPAADQPDPSGGPAIRFTVTFNHPAIDFDPTKIALSGGLPGLTATTLSDSNDTVFIIAVSGMGPTAGPVRAYIDQGLFHDRFGTPNDRAPNFAGVFYNPTLPPSLLPAVASLYTHSEEHYIDHVAYDYRQYLKREPDAAGLHFWVSHMEAPLGDSNHYSDEQVDAYFIGSDEYINFRYRGNLHDWVQGMYTDLLLRQPSPAETDLWLRALAAGESESAVAFGIAASREAEEGVIKQDYRTFLGRAASQAEIDLYTNAFLVGESNEDILRSFFGSTEYYQDSQKGKDDKASWVAAAYLDVLKRPARPDEIAFWVGELMKPQL